MKEVVVISGKGGTGKTSLTASLAALWEHIVIADCDVDAADLHLLLAPKIQETTDFYAGVRARIDPERCTRCSACRDACVFDAITKDFHVNDTACEGCGVCKYVCPEEAVILLPHLCGKWYRSETRFGPLIHAKLGIAAENSGKLVSLIRKEAKRLAESRRCGILLMDGAPGIGCPVISSIGGASLVLIVAEPTVSGVHDMERVHRLTKHFRIPAAIIVNKADLNREMTSQLKNTAERFRIPFLGEIPYDPSVTRAMVRGKTVVELDESPASQAIRAVSSKLLERLDISKTKTGRVHAQA
jgi:MinD superfamily P-loop ATPase